MRGIVKKEFANGGAVNLCIFVKCLGIQLNHCTASVLYQTDYKIYVQFICIITLFFLLKTCATCYFLDFLSLVTAKFLDPNRSTWMNITIARNWRPNLRFLSPCQIYRSFQ